MDEDTMSPFEMAVLAAQTRSNLRRLADFNGYPPHIEDAFGIVDEQLAGMIEAQAK